MTAPDQPTLRDRIKAALTTACPNHAHCDRMGPAVWGVVKGELDAKDRQIHILTVAINAAKEMTGVHKARVEELRERLRKERLITAEQGRQLRQYHVIAERHQQIGDL